MDMEFADEGGEGATPYEVLLDAAMRGDSMRFTRQDGVEEQWRIMQPLLDAPPPVQPYAKGTWGPDAGDAPAGRLRRLARSVGGVMTTVDGARAVPAAEPQSAAAPSPFPPIESFGFLSNCHTAALVAPDGAIAWLCVPSFDAPSVFGDDPGSPGRLLPRRAVRPRRPRRADVRARHQHARDHLAHVERLGRRARRAHDGPAQRRGHGDAAHAPAGRRRRRPPAGADDRVHRGQRRDGARVRARLRLRAHRRRVDAPRRPPHRRRARRGRRRCACAPTWRSGSRAAARAPATRCARARWPTARCRGRRSWHRRPATRRRRRRWPRPPASGGRGWTGRGCPTTSSASRSHARSWRSRA